MHRVLDGAVDTDETCWLTVHIVSAYVPDNNMPQADLPPLIAQVPDNRSGLSTARTPNGRRLFPLNLKLFPQFAYFPNISIVAAFPRIETRRKFH